MQLLNSPAVSISELISAGIGWLQISFIRGVTWTYGAFFSCCVYRGHELRPCFNHCTTCAHNSGLVKFQLPRLS